MGRRSKLNQAALNKIQEHLGEGYLDRDFANLLNVHPDTFSDWKIKGEKAKSGIFYRFHLLLLQDIAQLDRRITKPWLSKVDEGDMKAIEAALKKHPRLRAEFKEEPLKSESNITLEDKNKDVINERIAKFIAQLQQRGHTVSGNDSDESLDTDNTSR